MHKKLRSRITIVDTSRPTWAASQFSLCLNTTLYMVDLVASHQVPERRHGISLPILLDCCAAISIEHSRSRTCWLWYRGPTRLPRPRVCQDDLQLTCRVHATDIVMKAFLVLRARRCEADGGMGHGFPIRSGQSFLPSQTPLLLISTRATMQPRSSTSSNAEREKKNPRIEADPRSTL